MTPFKPGIYSNYNQASIVLRGNPVLYVPPPTIGVLELADSSVNFAVRPWVNSKDYWGLYFDMMEKVKKRFDAEGVSIPFPQRDVHVYDHTGAGRLVEHARGA